ncbi:Dam family site-specific DNA-(adenine-N6)-methyltransferase [Pseudoalteromonas sp. MIP2626]|uniref:DNA adenine methylase n=1 Tax=Pseudoalteromonas sp. MIP2626 TaxID=2705464 RepID=UPI0015C81ADD|nr:Dam family site-specific DNA-(adenine-N6)-methyltransferase [Pseudoalteromonas sp. MIP2626]NYR11318.1 Dam family site-specific DNA-(adenine-N6)-methyltransferase [Pseudoalteromonas sp. MIP2626]
MKARVNVPPIKSQGIKTKLVPWIELLIPKDFSGNWIEPFMGTGVVGFNLAPPNALLRDTNPHLINFYMGLKTGEITPEIVREHLEKEGAILLDKGEEHYYFIRERFNAEHSPLDFLFLNRACFNGMMRFNRKGGFNVPFCRKPTRFAKAYVTKIVNQVSITQQTIIEKNIDFKCQPFELTLAEAKSGDIVYCDPPYLGRNADYFNSWDESHEKKLFDALSSSKADFILSTWHHNDFRKNENIELYWNKFNIYTREHFYHVGASEKNRKPMIEAISSTIDLDII